MREIFDGHLWIGHAGDLCDPAIFEREGIRALVHLALEERLPQLSRELLFCHFPLRDGGNDAGVLAAALETTASLIRTKVPTLICCSAGMSRTPAITAGSLALATNADPAACLAGVIQGHPHDVSPLLWDAVLDYICSRGGI